MLHVADLPKVCATPTNSNAHVLPAGSKVIEMHVRGIHCEYIHLHIVYKRAAQIYITVK